MGKFKADGLNEELENQIYTRHRDNIQSNITSKLDSIESVKSFKNQFLFYIENIIIRNSMYHFTRNTVMMIDHSLSKLSKSRYD